MESWGDILGLNITPAHKKIEEFRQKMEKYNEYFSRPELTLEHYIESLSEDDNSLLRECLKAGKKEKGYFVKYSNWEVLTDKSELYEDPKKYIISEEKEARENIANVERSLDKLKSLNYKGSNLRKIQSALELSLEIAEFTFDMADLGKKRRGLVLHYTKYLAAKSIYKNPVEIINNQKSRDEVIKAIFPERAEFDEYNNLVIDSREFLINELRGIISERRDQLYFFQIFSSYRLKKAEKKMPPPSIVNSFSKDEREYLRLLGDRIYGREDMSKETVKEALFA